MKKLSLLLLAGAALGMSSCSNDEPLINNGVAEGVNFTIKLDDINTRAIGDGSVATHLTYVIYNADSYDKVPVRVERISQAFTNGVANVNIPLVDGVSYKIAFLAQSESQFQTIDDATGIMNFRYSPNSTSNPKGNYDAFYSVTDAFVATSGLKEDITLTRPFAQINVGVADYDVAKQDGFSLERGVIYLSGQTYSKMNMLDGSVSDPIAYEVSTSTPTSTPTYSTKENLVVGDKSYYWGGMAFVLVDEEPTIVNTVNYVYRGPGRKIKTVAVNQVPVRRNYRTNLIGNFLTNEANFNIVIDQNFATPDIVPEEVTDASTFAVEAAKDGNYVKVPAGTDITSTTPIELGDGVMLSVEGTLNAPITVGNGKSASIFGSGTVVTDNTQSVKPVSIQGQTYNAGVYVNGGDLSVSNVTFENKNGNKVCIFASGGTPFEAKGKLTLNNVTMNSENTSIFSENMQLNMTGCNITTSVTTTAYAVTLTGQTSVPVKLDPTNKGWADDYDVVLTNTNITGSHGAIAVNNAVRVLINSGDFTTTLGSCYCIYFTSARVDVVGGNFKAAGPYCIWADYNTNPTADGMINIMGGNWSSKQILVGYNGSSLTGQDIVLANGYIWGQSGNTDCPNSVEKSNE